MENGFKPNKPQNYAGILILPPISDPNPKTEHLDAINPASPPLLPPTVLSLFHGFNALPHTRLTVSGAIPNWGTQLLTKGIAPEVLKQLINTESVHFLLILLARPIVDEKPYI